MKKILNLFLLLLVGLFLTACNSQKHRIIRINIGGYYNVESTFTIIAERSFLTNEKVAKLREGLTAVLDDIDKKFDIQKRVDNYKTEIVLVNEAAGIEPVEVSPDVIEVLKIGLAATEMSIPKGEEVALFDLSIAPVWDLWGFTTQSYLEPGSKHIYIPSEEEISDALALVNYKNIVIDEEASTIFLTEPGMKLDFGGIAKGYAADKTKEYLIEAGISRAIINIGGNVHTIGRGIYSDGTERDWGLGLRTPYYDEFAGLLPETFGVYQTNDKTVVSSGVYEKYFTDENGQEYHHIIDPRTGYPVYNDVIAIVIIMDNSIWADALSTVIFSLGLKEGMALVENITDAECIFVVTEGSGNSIYTSTGAAEHFKYNEELNNHNYTYKGIYRGE